MRFTLLLALLQTATPFVLPAPTGKFAVGTTSWHVTDSSRREEFTGGVAPRQIKVLAWYPIAARGKGATAPYLREGLAEVRAFASLLKPDDAFDALEGVVTHAELDAPPRAGGGKFPVLVFSHGYTGIPSSYTALLEDLASHGYAVLSVIHPYEATATTLADGRVVGMLDDNGKFLVPIQAVFSEWATEDATMAAVTKSTGEAEQLKLLGGYISSVPKTNQVVRRWVDDERAVLDQVSLDAKSVAGPSTSLRVGRLAARLDLTRVGVFGHSMGGVAAGEFCLNDRRCKAGLNLDGIPQSGSMIDEPAGRLTKEKMPASFLMVYSARPGRAGASDVIYRRAARKYIRVDVAGTLHAEFSDMPFWGGPLRARPILGTIDPVRVTEITRRIVREFFDQELLGRVSPLLSGKASMPEVTVECCG